MVYDCFLFFNEGELLKLRLNMLKDVVDRFVLVESRMTVSGKRKALWYDEHKGEFAEFADRIVHVVADGEPEVDGWEGDAKWNWAREWHQRNQIVKGLEGATDDDVVLTGDVDEIPSEGFVREVKERLARDDGQVVISEQMVCYYAFNLRDVKDMTMTAGTRGCTVGYLRRGVLDGADFSRFGKMFLAVNRGTTVEKLRKIGRSEGGMSGNEIDGSRYSFVAEGGWHFSYLMTPERMADKIRSFAHQELNRPEIVDVGAIRRRVARGEDLFGRPTFYEPLRLDGRFPAYLREHAEDYADYIVPYSRYVAIKAVMFRMLVGAVRFVRTVGKSLKTVL